MSKEIVETREAASADNKAENLSVSVWDSMRPENKRVTEKQAKSEEKSEAKTTVDFPSPDKIADGSTTKIEVNVEGTVRNIFMHVPKNYDESKPTPVVVVFNGWGDKPGPGGTKAGAAGLEALTGLSAKADEKNFFVLYMSGNPKKDLSYNNGQYPFSKTDDVGYTTAVLEALNKNYNIDNERITLTGYSQGASFAHRAAAELPEKFRPANLVDVSGWTTGKEKPAPEGMNFLSIQSQEDHVAPVDGRWFGLHMDSEAKSVNRYLQANSLKVDFNVPPVDAARPEVEEKSWRGATGAKIESIVLPHYNGHDWHGSPGSSAPVDATEKLVEFIRDTRRVSKPN
ncbi:hypothetical protein BH11CYA1_BH11CYA1_49480 [soil metagenome]